MIIKQPTENRYAHGWLLALTGGGGGDREALDKKKKKIKYESGRKGRGKIKNERGKQYFNQVFFFFLCFVCKDQSRI